MPCRRGGGPATSKARQKLANPSPTGTPVPDDDRRPESAVAKGLNHGDHGEHRGIGNAGRSALRKDRGNSLNGERMRVNSANCRACLRGLCGLCGGNLFGDPENAGGGVDAESSTMRRETRFNLPRGAIFGYHRARFGESSGNAG